jgi:hypothetical protein
MEFLFVIINNICDVNIHLYQYEFIDYKDYDMSECGEWYSPRDVPKKFE